ncbi:ac92-like protein [Penaeus vannamei nudivirus]|nr:ac92-like protein [Penaeus vannamei nucleopolyhedrovirus]
MFQTVVREVIPTTYKIIDEPALIEEFKIAVCKVYAYITKIKPKPQLVTAGKYLLIYQKELYNFVNNILNKGNRMGEFDNTFEYSRASYDDLMKKLNINTKFEPNDLQYAKNVWGPIYWNFLHLASILCKTDNQKATFAYLLMNFNLVLICSECAFNFLDKKPFTLTMMILLSGDTITSLYNFHNIVNKALHKKQFQYSDFLLKYNIVAVKESGIKTYTFLSVV